MGSEWDLRIESPDHKSPHCSLYSNHHVPSWETSPWLWVGTIPEPSLPYAATHWIEVLDLRKNTSGKQLKFWLKFFLFWFVLIYFSTLDLGNVVLFLIFSLVLLFFLSFFCRVYICAMTHTFQYSILTCIFVFALLFSSLIYSLLLSRNRTALLIVFLLSVFPLS
jgi:hypothetical protein